MSRTRRASGEGSIYRRRDGRYVGQYKVDGKLRYVYGLTKADVKEKLDIELKKIEQNIDFESQEMTLGKWLKEWLDDYAKPSIKISTYVSYETYIRAHIGGHRINNIKLKDLKVSDFQRFFNEKTKSGSLVKSGEGLSAKTVSNMYNAIHSSLEQAVLNGYITRNPTVGVRLPRKPKKEMRVLSVDEQRKLMNAVHNSNEPSALGINIALYTGMRLGEVIGLQWRDIHFEENSIKVRRTINRVKDVDGETDNKTKIVFGDTKSANSYNRLIPIMKPLREELQKHLEQQKAFFEDHDLQWSEEGFVIINKAFKFYEPKNYQIFFKKYVKRAGINDTNFHALRHTFATRSVESGIDVSVLSKILGHYSPAITLERYVHTLKDHAFASMDKLSNAFVDMGLSEAIEEKEIEHKNEEPKFELIM